jgi:hypothetical protein
MLSSLIHEYVISNCICPFLDCKDRYNLSVTSKFFTHVVKLYKKFFKEKDDEVYKFIVEKVKENIKKELQMFIDLIFNVSISLTDRIYIYNDDLQDGVYYYSKNIFFREYHSPFYFYPMLNIRSHNLYLVIFVKNRAHKTKIFKNYFSSYIEEDEINYFNLKFNEKVLKLV